MILSKPSLTDDGWRQSLPLVNIGGVVTFSPWIDVTAGGVQRYEQSPLGRIDLLWGPLLAWGVNSYRPKGKISQDAESFISPFNHPFATKTLLFIDASAREGIFDSIREFAEQMSKVTGNRDFHAERTCFTTISYFPRFSVQRSRPELLLGGAGIS
ncbi:hypothetical protein RRF57_007886 [Xylaria bambusicola]|uniref:Uncharacterized protein n=1 Tax=Xylaria bambusicola TaxID=326684 RepID=A0AAN7UNG5_9PEZI